jgi:TPR repeat protein
MWVGHFFYSEHVRDKYKKAADAGNLDAMHKMGQSYCCGPPGGAYYDTMKALNYWCEAAKKGHADSQYSVGNIYENAFKVPEVPIKKNDARAWMWFTLAASQGHAEAAARKRNIEDYMTPDNFAKANVMLQNWHNVRCLPWEEPKGAWDPAWVQEQKEQLEKQQQKDFSKPMKKMQKRDMHRVY